MRICEEVFASRPRFFDNLPGRQANYWMIGPDARGRLWTVSLLVREDGRAFPINAWPSKPQQVRRYEEAQNS